MSFLLFYSGMSEFNCLVVVLGAIRDAMAQKDDDWKKWGLEELVENLRKYTDRNPLPLVESSLPPTSPTVLGN